MNICYFFNAICTECGKEVHTKTDQTHNKQFVCSKICNTMRFVSKEKKKDKDVKKSTDNYIKSNYIESNCIKCNTSIYGTPIKLSRKNNMCTNCFNICETDFTCEICKIVYFDTHLSFNKINRAICKQCIKI
jgi:hypothetical protein